MKWVGFLCLLIFMVAGCSDLSRHHSLEFSKAKKIYWITWDGVNLIGRIRSADINNPGTAVTLIDNLAHEPVAIEVDSIRKKMYWIDNDDKKILRAGLDGSGVETIIDGGTWLRDICLDMKGKKIYWIDDPDIKRANLDGTSAEVLFDDM
jgi:hypothetical protein